MPSPRKSKTATAISASVKNAPTVEIALNIAPVSPLQGQAYPSTQRSQSANAVRATPTSSASSAPAEYGKPCAKLPQCEAKCQDDEAQGKIQHHIDHLPTKPRRRNAPTKCSY